MEKEKLEFYLKKFMHELANLNQNIFSSGDYNDFLSLCNNDISILALLEDNPTSTARQISLRLGLPKTTVVTAVARLVKKGYINRKTNCNDAREQLLELTDLGKKLNYDHHQYEKNFIEGLMGYFNEDDYEQISNIFERSKLCKISK